MKAKAVDRFSPEVLPPLSLMLITHARNIGIKFSTKSLMMNPNMKVLFISYENFFPLGCFYTHGSFSKRRVKGSPKIKIVR